MSMQLDPNQLKESQRQSWNSVSEGWQIWWKTFANTFLQPIAIIPTVRGWLLPQLLSNSQSVMVVDDEPDIVEPIKLWLQRKGLEIHEFTDPLLALEYFKNNADSIDVILSDIRMPQLNGYELVKRIKNIRSEVRVILISAFEINPQEMANLLPNIKIDSLISKPISLRDLTKVIETSLKRA